MIAALPLACLFLAPQDGVAPAEVQSAIRRGVVLLVERQESYDPESDRKQQSGRTKPGGKNGEPTGKSPSGEKAKAASKSAPAREWPYEGVYRVSGEIPIGYRVGGTAIGALALLETGELGADAQAALERALDFVIEGLDHPLLSPGFEGGYDTRGWGHAYALGYLLRLRALERVPAKRRAEVDKSVRRLVDTLEKTAIGTQGGWNYSRGKNPDDAEPSTFMTAPTLQFLFEAAKQGEKVDRKVVDRALDVLEKGRQESGAFQYGVDPEHHTGKGFEAIEGATGRSPVCEVTLYLAGRSTQERIRGALDAFFEHWEWLEKRRQQTGTHVPPYMIAPYYFFYAHRYAAQAIEMLPEEQRPELRQKLYALLWKVREEDGGWNDRVFPRSECFGTAMAMLALKSPELPAPAAWASK